MRGRLDPSGTGIISVGMLAFLGVLLLIIALPARSDDVRPIQVLIKELPSGEYDIQWSVPKVMKPQSMPSPRLPEGCRPVGERTFVDRPSAWLTRQTYECPGGLAGRSIGIDYAISSIGLSTLMRVEFQTGDRYARLLGPGEDTWIIPETSAGGLARRLEGMRRTLVDGARHVVRSWVHLAFLLGLCLVGDVRTRLQLATTFFGAQVLAVLGSAWLGVTLPLPLAEIGVALAAAILAVQALQPPDRRRQLAGLVAGAGIVHGLGVPHLLSAGDSGGVARMLDLLVGVVGMDAVLVLSIVLLSGLGHLIRMVPGRDRLGRVAIHGVGGLAVALAIHAVVQGPDAAARAGERKLDLPSMATPGGRTMPGSRRVATATPDAAIQSFLAIEAFEVRHEVLVRLRDVASSVGAGTDSELAIADQPMIKARVHDLIRDRVVFEIDGATPEPVSERVDFMTLDEKGSLPRTGPVPEQVESAWIGVTTVYLTRTVAQEVVCTWTFAGTGGEIPATVTDPEISNSIVLTPTERVLRWENALSEDPVPRVSAIAVEPRTLTLPMWSLVAILMAGVLAIVEWRRHRPALSATVARGGLAAAVLLGPVGTLAVPAPAVGDSTPNPDEAKRILARVLPNVYRALEFREESAVFDRLALSVKGETLAQVYLDHRRGLELEERGGARARVEAVEVVEVESVAPAGSGGFAAEAVWTVGGTVTHFGHRHFRQNRYDARVTLVPDDGNWKLQAIEVWEEERVR